MVDLKKLRRAVEKEFASLVAKAGFRHLSSEEDKHGFELIYTAADRYIRLYANTNPRDGSPCFNIVLGEGSVESPESDWNSVALWRMCSGGRDESGYSIESVSDISRFVVALRKDLELFNQGFLAGDLREFHSIRAAQAKQREPYRILKPDKDGRYRVRQDPRSKRLKEKYSKA